VLTKQAGRLGSEASARKEPETLAQIRACASVVAQAAAGQGPAPQGAFQASVRFRIGWRADVGPRPGVTAQDDVEICQGFSPAAHSRPQLSRRT